MRRSTDRWRSFMWRESRMTRPSPGTSYTTLLDSTATTPVADASGACQAGRQRHAMKWDHEGSAD